MEPRDRTFKPVKLFWQAGSSGAVNKTRRGTVWLVSADARTAVCGLARNKINFRVAREMASRMFIEFVALRFNGQRVRDTDRIRS